MYSTFSKSALNLDLSLTLIMHSCYYSITPEGHYNTIQCTVQMQNKTKQPLNKLMGQEGQLFMSKLHRLHPSEGQETHKTDERNHLKEEWTTTREQSGDTTLPIHTLILVTLKTLMWPNDSYMTSTTHRCDQCVKNTKEVRMPQVRRIKEASWARAKQIQLT